MSNKNIKYLILLALILTSCVSTKIPEGWLPEEHEGFVYNANGGYLYLEFLISSQENKMLMEDSLSIFTEMVNEADTTNKHVSTKGEFLGISADTVMLVSDKSIVYKVSARKIKYAQLEFSDRSPGTVALLGTLGILVTPFANGMYAIISAPLFLTSLLIGTTGEAQRNVFFAEDPGLKWFTEQSLFARFPQGITRDIDLSKIKATKHVKYYKTNYRK